MLYTKDILPILEQIQDRTTVPGAHSKKRVVLYGVPEHYFAKAIALINDFSALEVVYMVDRKAAVGSFMMGDYKVFPPQTLQSRDFDFIIVISKSRDSVMQIRGYLESLGFEREKDYFDLIPTDRAEFEWNSGTIGPLATKFYEWDYEVIKNTTELPQYYPQGALSRLLGIARGNSISFKDKTVFEIGYGPSLIVPVVFCLLGAKKVYACDYLKIKYGNSGLFYENLPAPFRRLCSWVYEDPSVLQIFGAESFDDFFRRVNDIVTFHPDNHSYHVNPDRIVVLNEKRGNLESIDITDNEIDFAYSNGVLEHIDALDQAMRELARVLKHGGCGWHIITCAMHWNFKGFEGKPSENPLEFLKYHPDEYAALQQGNWGYERPWRPSDYLRAIENSGLCGTLLQTLSATQDQIPRSIHPYYHKYEKNDLCTTQATIWTAKP
jgi:SAM-dependent methyltransferase